MLISLCTGDEPQLIAERLGDGGGGALKKLLTESLNETLRPIRSRRAELEKEPEYIRKVLLDGVEAAQAMAQATLKEVRSVMTMEI